MLFEHSKKDILSKQTCEQVITINKNVKWPLVGQCDTNLTEREERREGEKKQIFEINGSQHWKL